MNQIQLPKALFVNETIPASYLAKDILVDFDGAQVIFESQDGKVKMFVTMGQMQRVFKGGARRFAEMLTDQEELEVA